MNDIIAELTNEMNTYFDEAGTNTVTIEQMLNWLKTEHMLLLPTDRSCLVSEIVMIKLVAIKQMIDTLSLALPV